FLSRYEQLGREPGWNAEEKQIAQEFIAHAKALRSSPASERLKLLKSWGGVTIAYRRRMIDSPSYTLNHEEVEKALEEGIVFAEGLTPVAADVDNYGAVRGIRFSRPSGLESAEHWLPAHTVFVAAGTQPNTVLAREHPAHFA